jgi:hypothetical protein
MGTLKFNYVRAFTGTSARSLQVYVNGTQRGSDITVSPTLDTVVLYSNTINISGNVQLEIRSTGSAQVKVDDISWTSFADAASPTITAVTLTNVLTNTYGTASPWVSYTATGANLTNQITNTPVAGWEISTNNSIWTTNATAVNTNTTMYVRTAAIRVAGTNNGTAVVTLSGGGASNSVSVTTSASGNVVSPAVLTISGISISNKVYDGTNTATITGTATYTGLTNSDNFTVSGTPSATFSDKNVATNKPVTVVGYTTPSANYSLTQPTNLVANITAKGLTITANDVTKARGVALTSPQSGSGAFTPSGLISGESITSVTITYTNGADSAAAAGIYSNAVVPSAPIGITTNNYSINFVPGTLTVDATPTLTLNTSTLNAFSTTYGTNSANQSFTVIGGNLSNNVTVSAPTPFQVSTNASNNFAASLVLTAVSNAVPSTTIYVTLPATAPAATNHTGTITVSSDGASNKTISIATSAVSPKGLTIGGLSGSNRVYDGTTNGSATGTPVYVGQVNGESNVVTPVVTWSFTNKTVGTNKTLIASANFAPPNGNYSITSQPSLTANITQASLSLTNVVATSRAYLAGNTNVSVGGTLAGVFSNDVVTASLTGTVTSANAGTSLPVAVGVVLSGADANNYTAVAPTGVTVDITKATNTITFNQPPAMLAGVTNVLGATANSGLTVTYVSGNTNVARISSNTVISVASGSATITASQTGDSNYDAASPVSQVLKVTGPLGNVTSNSIGWNFGTNTPGNASPTNSAANLTVGAISQGNNSGTTALLDPSSVSSSYSGASGSYNAGAAARGGSLNIATNGSTYFEFSLTPSNGYGFTVTAVSFGSRSTGTGPTAYSIRSSADGYNSDLATGSMSANSGWALMSNTGLNVRGVDATSFRIYGYSGTGTTTTANWRIDDLTLTVSVAPILPGITTSGSFATVSTIYGTASAPSTNSVAVTGGSLTSNITATVTNLFQISTNGTNWASSVSYPTNASGFTDGLMYLRLSSNAPAGTYSNMVVALTSGSASTNVPIPTSMVDRLSITGSFTANNKSYDGTSNAVVATRSLAGVLSSDAANVNLTGGAAAFATADVGTGITVTLTGATLSGAAAANYSLSSVSTTTADITKATPIISVTGGTSFTYSGSPQGPVTSNVTGSTGAVSYSYEGTGGTSYTASATKPMTAGTYTVTATVAADANYDTASSSATAFTIAKATPSITALPTASAISFGQTLASSVLSNGTASVDGSFSFTTTSTAPSAGTVNQPVTFTPTDTANYYTASTTASVTVNKADATVTWPTAATITYGEALSAATLTGGSGDGTFAFTSPSTVPSAGAAQSFQVTFAPTSGNYKTATQTVSVTVNKATPTISFVPSASAITYGQTLGSSVLSGGTASTAGTYAFTTPSTAPNAGTASQNVTFTPNDTANYNTASTTVSVTVGKATPTITVLPTASEIIYLQTLAESNLTGGAASTAGTFAFTTPSTAPNVGTANQGVTFTPSDRVNYNTATTIASVTVSKIDQTITGLAATDSKVYGDADYTLAVTQGLSTGALSYSSSNTGVATINLTTGSVHVVGAGTTTLTVNQAADANYNAAPAVTQTLTVNPANQADVSGSLALATITFGNTTTVTASGGTGTGLYEFRQNGGTGSVSFTGTGVSRTITPTVVGTAVIEVRRVADTNYNDSSWFAAGTLTMNPAAPSGLAYANINGTVGTAISNVTPAVTGSGICCCTYSIDPALPSGLLLNPTSGVISGTPSVAAASAIYTVTAANAGGYATTTLTVAVLPVVPSDLSYANINGTVGTAISNVTPAVTGTVDSYSISPALPAGLVLNTGTGVISGTPSAAAASDTYTVTATNAGGYASTTLTIGVGYAVGPVAVADSLTKPADNEPYMIPVSQLLANDYRITNSSGATVTTGLTVSAVTSGLGNTAVLSGVSIQFTPSNGSTDTFTYTVTDGTKTARATVTITTETQAPAFTLQFVKKGMATFAGGNTTVTHDFLGVPGQVYLLEYTTDMEGAWTSAGNQNTGATGSFSVTFTKSGDVAADWNAHMFFRARLVR